MALILIKTYQFPPLFVSHSLMCVKKHKEESGCSGLRDKTAFVALSKFDEMNLLNGELPFLLLIA